MCTIVICGSYNQMEDMKAIKGLLEEISANIRVVLPKPNLNMELMKKREKWLRTIDDADIVIGVPKSYDGKIPQYGESTSYEIAYARHTKEYVIDFEKVNGSCAEFCYILIKCLILKNMI